MVQKEKKKCRNLMVVYFGSEDNWDIPSDREYAEMTKKLFSMAPEVVASLPILVAGRLSMRLIPERVALVEGNTLKFVPTPRVRRAPKVILDDKFVKAAAARLDSLLTQGKDGVVLVPYYARIKTSLTT
ncbi:MAG: hypothetical protein A2Y38_01760 [Spirochaetes bacterium GWB1_59_5]|nr:MAG: hypothetical protein A2Y38_01760 [Spirochaetes bacterium GWB1_59_5]